MSHYDDDDVPPSAAELRAMRADRLVAELRKLPSFRFTVNELAILLRTNWGKFQESYREKDCDIIERMAEREKVKL